MLRWWRKLRNGDCSRAPEMVDIFHGGAGWGWKITSSETQSSYDRWNLVTREWSVLIRPTKTLLSWDSSFSQLLPRFLANQGGGRNSLSSRFLICALLPSISAREERVSGFCISQRLSEFGWWKWMVLGWLETWGIDYTSNDSGKYLWTWNSCHACCFSIFPSYIIVSCWHVSRTIKLKNIYWSKEAFVILLIRSFFNSP